MPASEAPLEEGEQAFARGALGRLLGEPERRDLVQNGAFPEQLEVENLPASARVAELGESLS